MELGVSSFGFDAKATHALCFNQFSLNSSFIGSYEFVNSLVAMLVGSQFLGSECIHYMLFFLVCLFGFYAYFGAYSSFGSRISSNHLFCIRSENRFICRRCNRLTCCPVAKVGSMMMPPVSVDPSFEYLPMVSTHPIYYFDHHFHFLRSFGLNLHSSSPTTRRHSFEWKINL